MSKRARYKRARTIRFSHRCEHRVRLERSSIAEASAVQCHESMTAEVREALGLQFWVKPKRKRHSKIQSDYDRCRIYAGQNLCLLIVPRKGYNQISLSLANAGIPHRDLIIKGRRYAGQMLCKADPSKIASVLRKHFMVGRFTTVNTLED